MTRMGPSVLPLSEKLLFVLNWLARRLPGGGGVKPYIPDFRRAFDHFCLHAGALTPFPLPPWQLSTKCRQDYH